MDFWTTSAIDPRFFACNDWTIICAALIDLTGAFVFSVPE